MSAAKPTTTPAATEEEWAEGVDGFFADFGATASDGPSQRKRSRTAALARRHGGGSGGAASTIDGSAQSKADRDDVVAAARRRITATVAGRASAKEIARAQRRVQRERGTQAANSTAVGDEAKRATSTSAVATDAERIEPRTRMCHTRSKLAQKMERKAQRREEQRSHAIKHRKALRKGPRRVK